MYSIKNSFRESNIVRVCTKMHGLGDKIPQNVTQLYFTINMVVEKLISPTVPFCEKWRPIEPIKHTIDCSQNVLHVSIDADCRAMLCKRGLCRHAVSVRLSARVSVTFVHSVKTNKDVFEMFSPPGSHTVLVFPYQTGWRYSDGNPLTGASNADVVGRNRNSEPIISSFTGWC